MAEIRVVLSDFVEKIEKYIHLEVALFKEQVKEDFVQRRNAAIVIFGAMLIGFIGFAAFSVALVHFIAFKTEWPNWACEGIVAFLYLAVSATGMLVVLLKKEPGLVEKMKDSNSSNHTEGLSSGLNTQQEISYVQHQSA